MDTEIARCMLEKRWGKWPYPLIKFVMRTPINGAQTTIWCALEDSIKSDTGLYYANCREKQPHQNTLLEADQKRLWELSEKMVGLKKQ